MTDNTKPTTWRERLTDILYDDYVYWDGTRALRIWAFLMGITLVAATLMAITFGILSIIPTPTPHEIYEREYAACMAQETLTHEQCHDIALEAID